MFTNRFIDRDVKVRLLNRLLSCVVLWGRECWKMTDGDRRKLRAFQIRITRKSLNFVPIFGDEKGHFWRRTFRATHGILSSLGIQAWDIRALELQWTWCGHVWRHRHEHYLWDLFTFKDIQWQQSRHILIGGHGLALAGFHTQWAPP